MSGLNGLITDFGGVLTTSVIESFKAFCLEFGVDPQRLKDVLRTEEYDAEDHPLRQIEIGGITGEDFNAYLAEALSHGLESPLDPQGLKDRLFYKVQPEPLMVNAVKVIRESGKRTALLSNSWGGDGYPREAFEVLFDVVILSGEVGMRKPSPDIYLLAADKLGLEPEECLFIDDLEANVKGAIAVGMAAIHHTDVTKTLEELSAKFEVSLS